MTRSISLAQSLSSRKIAVNFKMDFVVSKLLTVSFSEMLAVKSMFLRNKSLSRVKSVKDFHIENAKRGSIARANIKPKRDLKSCKIPPGTLSLAFVITYLDYFDLDRFYALYLCSKAFASFKIASTASTALTLSAASSNFPDAMIASRVLRARLTRLFTVPMAQSQTSAASS